MADNSLLPTASGNETFANDDIGGVKYPRAKVTWGPDGTANDTDVASGKPLPIQARHSDGTILSDNTGMKISTSQLASLLTSQGVFAAGAQQVSFPSDHPAIPVTPAGNVAHDAADSGNPVKQGAKATTALSGLTLVANNDRTDLFAGVDGVQIVRPHCNLEDLISGVLANTDGASTAVIAALGSGIKAYITTVIFANTSATAVTVDLRDGTAGSVKATFPVPANTSGLVCNLPVPIGFSANTAVAMDGSAAATTVTCTLIGFKSKV